MLFLYKAIHIHENGNVILICIFIAVFNTAHSLHVTGCIGSGLLTQLTGRQVVVPRI
jgi:hypothetical protein